MKPGRDRSETDRVLTHRRVWRLSAPIILSNLSVPLVGVVDTAVVGQDGTLIAAVGLGAMLFGLLYWGFGFLRMATVGLVAQAHGRGDTAELRHVPGRALLLGAAISALILLLRQPIETVAFAVIDGADAVERLAATYYDIRIWSAPAVLAQYTLLGWLLGTQQARAALTLLLTLHGSNIVLSIGLGHGLGWGVAGVALATLLSDYAAVAVGGGLVWRRLNRLPGGWQRARLLDRARAGALLRIGGNIFIRTTLLTLAFAWFTRTGAAIGTTALAANVVLMHLVSLAAHGLDGFAHTTEALVGHAVGARDRPAFRRAVRVCTLWAGVVAVATTLLFLAIGGWLIDALTADPAVRAAARSHLAWAAVAPVVSVWSYQLDGVFIGATRGPEMRTAMILAFLVYAGCMLALVPAFGNHGLWAALLIFLFARAAALMLFVPRILADLAPEPPASRPAGRFRPGQIIGLARARLARAGWCRAVRFPRRRSTGRRVW